MTRILTGLLFAFIIIAAIQTIRLQQAQLALANVERDQAQKQASDNAAAVQAWRAEWQRQQDADAARNAQDKAQDSATAAAVHEVAARYAALARRLTPPGTCKLSAEWVRAFNEAR